MPAHRAEPRAGAADAALEQQHVDDVPQRGHRMLVLGQAHRPGDDRGLGRQQPGSESPDLGLAQTGGAEDLRPVQGAHLVQVGVKSGCAGVEEVRPEV
jgi:hypothetical protein